MIEQNRKTWTVEIIEDPESGDLVLPFPQDMLDKVGWQTGDNLNWVDLGDGTWEITKIET